MGTAGVARHVSVPAVFRTSAITGIVLGTALSVPAAAQTGRWRADGRVLGEVEGDRPELAPNGREGRLADHERLSLRAGLEGELWLGEHLTLGGRTDTGDLTLTDGDWTLNGRPLEDLDDEAGETAFVREAWARLEARPGESSALGLEAGKRRLTLGAGLLLDDTTLGLVADFTRGPFEVRAGFGWPGPELVPPGPPVVHVRAAWAFGFLSRAELLYARYTGTAEAFEEDLARYVEVRALEAAAQRGRAAALAAAACLEPPPDTDVASVMHWLGAELSWSFPGGQVEAAWLTGFGQVEVDARLRNAACVAVLERRGRATSLRSETEVLGHAATVNARTHLEGALDDLWPGLFGIWLSGNAGRPGEGGDYEGFVSVAPYPERPTLFFDVGASSSLRTPRAATAGILGRGVLGGGPTLLWAPTETLSAELLLAYLIADTPNPGTDGEAYGPEGDLRVDWDAVDFLSVFASFEAARLGSFYPVSGTHWRAAAGVALRYED